MQTIGKGPEKKEKRGLGGLFAGILGGAIFLLFFFLILPGVPGALILSIVFGVLGLIAGSLIFRKRKKPEIEMAVQGVTQEMISEALKEGQEKLSKLRAYSAKIVHREIKIKTDSICDTTSKILEDIKQDPKDYKTARQFLNYYLDSTLKILQRYVEISGHGATSSEIQSVLKKVENTLSTIDSAFKKQLAKLMEDDVLDLDTEITVLKRTIEMEGLGEDFTEESKE